jgi:hypothetical protein
MNLASNGFIIGHSRAHHDTSLLIGQMVLVFSGIEIEVGCCLEHVAGSDIYPVVDKLVFKHKIEAVLQLMALRHAADLRRLVELQPLLQRVDRLRHRRNAFVHGRWDERTARLFLVRPAYGRAIRSETPCTLGMMCEELRRANALLLALRTWRRRWGIDGE